VPGVSLLQRGTCGVKVRKRVNPLALILGQVSRQERMSGPGVRLHQVEPMCEWKRTLTSHAVRDSGSVRPDSSGDVGYEERSPDTQEVKEIGRLTALSENETNQSYTRDDGERLDEVPDNEVSGDRAPHGSREAGGGKPGDEAYSGEKCVLE